MCRTEDDDIENFESGEVRVTPSRPRLRIREDVREQHCRTLRQAIHVWLDQYPEDFDDPPNYPSLTQLEAFCRKVLPNSELDIKVHRKASQIRRPPEPPLQKLGYPLPQGSMPPPLVLKSASVLNNNNSLHHPDHAIGSSIHTKDLSSSNVGGGRPPLPPRSHLNGLHQHGGPMVNREPYGDFLEIPESIFARQLTRMDCVSVLTNVGN